MRASSSSSAFVTAFESIHLQRPMRHAFPAVVIEPSACDLSLSTRLEALKRTFGEADRGHVVEAV